MKLSELVKNKYGKIIDEDSCPIHILNELGDVEVDKIDDMYKVGEKLVPFCKEDNCEECWNIEID